MPLSHHLRDSKNDPALMTHVVAGFPSVSHSREISQMMDDAGADVIEIQIPFSDPVADGKTMISCNEKSLQRGTTVSDAMDLASVLSQSVSAKIVLMTYYNIVFRRGVERFCQEAESAGVCAVIVPDMPLEEEPYEGFLALCQKHHLDWVPVISPVTSAERIHELAPHAGGFWYVVSRTGVTGADTAFQSSAQQQIEVIRSCSDLPIALAFGVGSREDMQSIAEVADVAVVGSAVQNIFLQEENSFERNLQTAEEFLGALLGR